jgi:EAL domain-containing protein (putative c-di-GMP-specific phosphodiesterase class I)
MGVIVPIGRSVLQRACRDAQRWAHGNPIAPAVHVNLSPVELRHPGFESGVICALTQSGLRSDRLVLEIPERAVVDEPQRTIAGLNQVRKLGTRLALDDFGTGDSSLSHLRSLPIDWLKLGKPFVDGTKRGRIDQSIVRMIIELARSVNVNVVAEGIESPEQLDSLRGLGCRFGQGFYLGRPAPLGPTGASTHIDFLAHRGAVDRPLG